jgi:hypothetical protein
MAHIVIPAPEPVEACGRMLNGGYAVQPPENGPVLRNKDRNITMPAKKKNQYDNILRKGEAMSRAPICNGIKRLLNVPLKPAVNTKNTNMVPCMVTRA